MKRSKKGGMLVGIGGLVLTIMLHKGWTVMNFEEWLEENYPKGPILRFGEPRQKDIIRFMQNAWDAGYREGFLKGFDGGGGGVKIGKLQP
jgi:hypothetical protein